MRLPLTLLTRTARSVFSKYEIDDIILFGSAMKGKTDAKDIDVLIIFKEMVDKNAERDFKKIQDIDIASITRKELYNDGFIAREGIWLEGRSLISGMDISSQLGFESVALVKYEIDSQTASNRVRFYYALQGRNKQPGFLSGIGGFRFSDNVLAIKYTSVEKLKEFLESWSLEYTIFPALIPARLGHILLRTN